jgi:hypothetical protein
MVPRSVRVAVLVLTAVLVGEGLAVALGLAMIVGGDASGRLDGLWSICVFGGAIPFLLERLRALKGVSRHGVLPDEPLPPSRRTWASMGLGMAAAGALHLGVVLASGLPPTTFNLTSDAIMIALGATSVLFDPWRRERRTLSRPRP